MNSCILLAAGFSSRFGSPKALAKFASLTVFEHLQSELIKTKLDHIIIVLGANQEQIKPLVLKHKTIKVVYNKDYNLGQTSSFKAGLTGLPDGNRAILLLPVDYPLIRAATIDRLIDHFFQTERKVLIPAYKGRRGHPPVFCQSLLEDFLSLPDERGVDSVIHSHENDTQELSLDDPGVVSTFNTQEEFEALLSKKVI